MLNKATSAVFLCAVLLAPGASWAQGMGMPTPDLDPASRKPTILKKVGIDQKIGSRIPFDLAFTDEAGRSVRMGDYFGKRPVVLVLAYYECPMLCTLVLNGVVGVLKTLEFEPGRDFDVVVVSINPKEGPMLAAEKKAVYLEHYGRPQTAAGWHFLTGKEPAIKALADSIGFRYAFDESVQQYAHGAAFEVLTPRGVIAQYFYGIEYPPRDLRFALIESSGNRLGTPVDQVLLLCYHYDPSTGKYGTSILRLVRIGGVATVAGFLAFLFVSLRRERHAADPLTTRI